MSDQTVNIETLNDAIAEYTREVLGREGVLTGWVLSVSTMRYGDDDPLYSWDYSCGPQTDLIRAVGLINTTRLEIEQIIWNASREPREDD